MNGWLWLAAALAVAGCAPASAQSTVQRCESKDGKVTYSNTQCPSGTTPVRKVNTEPPVSVEDRRTAAEMAKKDAAAAKQLEREQAKEEASEKRQAEDRAKSDAKSDAKARQRCVVAKRNLERAKASRAELSARSALTLDAMQKSDREIARREAVAAKDCAER